MVICVPIVGAKWFNTLYWYTSYGIQHSPRLHNPGRVLAVLKLKFQY